VTTRIQIELDSDERRGLTILAQRELRSIRDQARKIIRSELVRLSLLPYPGEEIINDQTSDRLNGRGESK
jgi:hypothetical protein